MTALWLLTILFGVAALVCCVLMVVASFRERAALSSRKDDQE